MPGKVDYFDVQVESGPNGFFYAGQKVSGSVIMRVIGSIKMQGHVTVMIRGESRTYWVNKTSDKIYESNQLHLNIQLDVAASIAGQDGETIPEGVHTIPFSYDLPMNLLSSFEGDFGYTRYNCAAKMRISDTSCFNPMMGSQGGPEMVAEKPFLLLALVARGIDRAMDAPVRRQEQTEVYGILRKKGVIMTEILMQQQHFRVGEAINAQIFIHNQTSQKIKSVDFYLLQHTRFEARSRYEAVEDVKEMNRAVECVSLGEVPGQTDGKLQTSLKIGAVPPSQNAGIINISYYLRLDYKPGNEIVVPIAIYSLDE